ncbi:hypothetical protein F5887DRAFT_979276 [Amanita rubescens]|nr:hypothetical protein F5887DRAFT_979276 [Amanita rubescens]
MSDAIEEFSLFDELVEVTGQSFGCTDLSRQLIRSIASYVCDTRRNAFTLYQITRRACEVYNKVTSLVEEVGNSGKDDWNIYRKSIVVIDPLEDGLFKLARMVEYESNKWFPDVTTVNDCVKSFEEWKNKRAEIRWFLDDFDDNVISQLPDYEGEAIDIVPYARQDDLSLLAALCDNITQSQKIATKATRILSVFKDPSEASTVQIIRAAMLIYATREISNTSKAMDVPQVWKAADSLLSFIITHLQRRKVTPNQEDVLENKVDEFERLLKNLPGAPVYRLKYDELRKRARDVRRPYHARTVALLDQNYVLFKRKDKHPEQLELFERAIEVSLRALEEATRSVTSIGLCDETKIQRNQAAKAFSDAEQANKNCFKAFKLSWDDRTTIGEAAKEDEERVRQTNTRLKYELKRRRYPQADREVSVTIMKDGHALSEHIFDKNTPLSALFWMEATKDSSLLQGWHFEHETEDDPSKFERIGSEKSVKDIRGQDAERRTVHLVYPQPPVLLPPRVQKPGQPFTQGVDYLERPVTYDQATRMVQRILSAKSQPGF